MELVVVVQIQYKRTQNMDNHTLLSSFGKWVAPINIEKLTEQITQTGQDRYTKKFTTYSYIKLLLLSHLEEVESLHAMSDTLFDDDVQQELGLDSISVSQLSRKHRTVDPNLLASIFYQLVGQIRHSQPGRTVMPVKIIDSSTMPLNLTNHPWATFRKTKGGVKLHLRLVFMENGSSYPEYANITTANEHDRNQLEVLVDDKEATYVFDRGYIDYERFDRMTDDGYFFVSRLKKNSITRTIKAFEVEQGSTIVTDQMVAVGGPTKRMDNLCRLIEVDDTKGNRLRLITNRFDLKASEISDMYRSRWTIELFFKWLKQHVKIKHFYGHSETAVINQIFLALIVYCLHVLIQLETESRKTILQISRLLKAKLWKDCRHWLRRISGIP